MLFYLVYISSAPHPMSDAELRELLAISRENNLRDELSGMLLYKDGNFMQVLEGRKLKVLTLAEKLRRDTRHKKMFVILEGDIEERAFEGWSMGFKHLTDLTAEQVPGYTEFMNIPLTPEAFAGEPNDVWRLLMLFKSAPDDER